MRWVCLRAFYTVHVPESICLKYCMHLTNPLLSSRLVKQQPGALLTAFTKGLNQVIKSVRVCVCFCVAREFGRWKVNSLAVEKRDSLGGSGGLALPLDPDFMHTIRQLGRRPSLQTITDSIIKKYGTHLLLSATLGGTVHCASKQASFIQPSLMWFFSICGTDFTVCCFLKNKAYEKYFWMSSLAAKKRSDHSGVDTRKRNWRWQQKQGLNGFIRPTSKRHDPLQGASPLAHRVIVLYAIGLYSVASVRQYEQVYVISRNNIVSFSTGCQVQ